MEKQKLSEEKKKKVSWSETPFLIHTNCVMLFINVMIVGHRKRLRRNYGRRKRLQHQEGDVVRVQEESQKVRIGMGMK